MGENKHARNTRTFFRIRQNGTHKNYLLISLLKEYHLTKFYRGLSGKHDEDITGQILCCVEEPLSPEDIGLAEGDATSVSTLTEEEKTVMGSFKPQWYGRDSGYKGGKHEDAEEFCSNTNGMQLCPLAAFCVSRPCLPIAICSTEFLKRGWPLLNSPMAQ